MHEGKAACPLVELHRGNADVHHDGIDLGDADGGQLLAHRRKAGRMERKATIVARHQRLPGSDGIGIAVEGVDTGTGLEQRGGVAARAKGRIDDGHARLRLERGEHFIEQHRDVGSRAGEFGRHSATPLRAAATSLAQLACAPFHSGPMPASSAGFQMKKNSPAPWK